MLAKTATVVALGGAVGALLRHLATVIWPVGAGSFPTTILVVNAIGCFAIGALAVASEHRWPHRPLLRPFLGAGVLGGFTTFSAYAVDVQDLVRGGHPVAGLTYLLLTPLLALTMVALAVTLTRRMVPPWRA